MTEFTAPRAGWYSDRAEPFVGRTEGSTVTEISFDVTEWQTIPPNAWTRLEGAPGHEILLEGTGSQRVMIRRTAEALTSAVVVADSSTNLTQAGDVVELDWDHE